MAMAVVVWMAGRGELGWVRCRLSGGFRDRESACAGVGVSRGSHGYVKVQELRAGAGASGTIQSSTKRSQREIMRAWCSGRRQGM